jgi:Protein of unknown function (DUF3800)
MRAPDVTSSAEQLSLPLFPAEPIDAIAAAPGAEAPPSRFGDFIVYVDESGDHGIEKLDPNYPVFVLAFCVFYKAHYSQKVVPAVHRFKFKHFGHDSFVLHEHEIRKEIAPFRFMNRAHRDSFMGELTSIIEASNFILISCVIQKDRLQGRPGPAVHPYYEALRFCLESLYELMREKQQDKHETHVVVERRGAKEDDDLELEFRRICDGANRLEQRLPFQVIFADKKTNSCGLQLADLVARPIGLSVLRPGQPNRAYQALMPKFFCSGGRQQVGIDFIDWGLKVFPTPESEKPR